jgi:hypothetical protein
MPRSKRQRSLKLSKMSSNDSSFRKFSKINKKRSRTVKRSLKVSVSGRLVNPVRWFLPATRCGVLIKLKRKTKEPGVQAWNNLSHHSNGDRLETLRRWVHRKASCCQKSCDKKQLMNWCRRFNKGIWIAISARSLRGSTCAQRLKRYHAALSATKCCRPLCDFD